MDCNGLQTSLGGGQEVSRGFTDSIFRLNLQAPIGKHKCVQNLAALQRTKDVVMGAKYIALTGDHWTSVSSHRYLSITAHVTGSEWKLESFVLTMLKTDTRHYTDECAAQFLSVAEAWGVQPKVTTVCTDSTQNMVPAAKSFPSSTYLVLLMWYREVVLFALQTLGFVMHWQSVIRSWGILHPC